MNPEEVPGLRQLLAALARGENPPVGSLGDWQIDLVTGGANNRLFHVQGPAGELAIKFTLRDRRQRAAREHAALQALEAAGQRIAPRPVLIDTKRYGLPVVVQSWLPGPVSPAPPRDEAGWQALLDHYLAIRTINPGNSKIQLRKAVLNFTNARQGVQAVNRMAGRLPPTAQPEDPRALLGRLNKTRFPLWKTPGLSICRTDPAPLNFIRRSGSWASVDWENSGWGDPAFEIADLLSHPAYLDVAPGRLEWAISYYCECAADPQAELRIRIYFNILQVFWVMRMARYLYEVPRRLDKRLVDRPPGWEQDIQTKYGRYVMQAKTALGGGQIG